VKLKFGCRFAAAVAIVTLTALNLSLCAGWQLTPEARVACCADEATCPMHRSDSRHSGPNRIATQAEADSCCAVSEQRHSSTPNASFVLFAPVAVTISDIAASTTLHHSTAVAVFDPPLNASSLPKHLLLSVLLV
jgi:hypothetical protein